MPSGVSTRRPGASRRNTTPIQPRVTARTALITATITAPVDPASAKSTARPVSPANRLPAYYVIKARKPVDDPRE